ncbi:nucleotide sugar dehydrogenase [Pelagibacteraceae bacterium]|nr:nucleotide sugar dehydrogenase [Pelagibacteraceae bacterium]
MQYKYDISIIGGLGHVGLPLGIMFASKGMKVNLLDINKKNAKIVQSGKMPFTEYGSEKILKKVIKSKKLSISTSLKNLTYSRTIVITVGTPLDQYNNPNLKEIMSPIKEIKKYLKNGQLIIIRSSVFPGTCQNIYNYLTKGLDVHISYCPERIKQGYAIEELSKLPQIVSGFSNEACEMASILFSKITKKIIRSTIKEAELIKLFTNSYRYIQFAMANQFYMMCEDNDLDYDNIRSMMSESYERVTDLPSAGLAAGPCLLKDTMQLSAFYKHNFLLGHSSMLVNEGLPSFIISKIEKKMNLNSIKVGLLGMAFKADVDDIRDSLSFKFKKELNFKGANVICSDRFIENRKDLVDEKTLIKSSDLIIICAPHTIYKKIDFNNKIVIDIWNILNQKQNFLTL